MNSESSNPGPVPAPSGDPASAPVAPFGTGAGRPAHVVRRAASTRRKLTLAGVGVAAFVAALLVTRLALGPNEPDLTPASAGATIDLAGLVERGESTIFSAEVADPAGGGPATIVLGPFFPDAPAPERTRVVRAGLAARLGFDPGRYAVYRLRVARIATATSGSTSGSASGSSGDNTPAGPPGRAPDGPADNAPAGGSPDNAPAQAQRAPWTLTISGTVALASGAVGQVLPLGAVAGETHQPTAQGALLARVHSGRVMLLAGEAAELLVVVRPAVTLSQLATVTISGLPGGPIALTKGVRRYVIPPGLRPSDDPRPSTSSSGS